MSTATTPQLALRAEAELGEGPCWDITSGTLLWVDITRCHIHRYDPASGADTVYEAPQQVGAVRPRSRGGVVANLREGIALLTPDGQANQWLVYWAMDGVRGNDAAVDPAGRLWAGTTRDDQEPGGGRLARIEPDGAVTTVLSGVTVSNGLGWDPEATRMYYVDSPTGQIDCFDYDRDSGMVSGRRPLCAVAGPGVPDGLCVDAEGGVWVAVNGAGQIRRYTPDGRLDRTLALPVTSVTACAFGGSGLRDLYVTTALGELDAGQQAQQELAGSLFVLAEAGEGKPENIFLG